MKISNLLVAGFLGLFLQKTTAQPLSVVALPNPYTFCDYSNNDSLQWNEDATYNPFGIAGTWSPVLQKHDLPESAVDLSIKATAGCGVAGFSFKYLLSLDLNDDGVMETVIDSNKPTLGFGIKTDEVDSIYRIARVIRDFEMDDPDHVKYAGFTLPYGSHKIKWTVTGCAETVVLELPIIVKDCKGPTVVCLNGLSVNGLNAGNGTNPPGVTVWASDFLLYAEDNSTDPSAIALALRDADINPGMGFPLDANGQPQANLFWDCSQLGTNTVELWAKDKFGNEDFCLTYLILSENTGACTGDPFYEVVCVNGPNCMMGVSDVSFEIWGSNPAFPNPFPGNPMVSSMGCYYFLGFPAMMPLSITPKKDFNPLNGVSTFDLVRISKHILNAQPFTTGLQWVAADINHNNQVTTFDIVELRKLILGIYTDFPANESWRFIRPLVFVPGQNPITNDMGETCQYDGITTCQFDAVKIGDLTGDAICNNFAPEQPADDRQPTLFSLQNHDLAAGQSIEIPIFLEKENSLLAWQFALNFNPDFIDIQETLQELLDGSEAMPMVVRTAPGRVAANWFSAEPRQFSDGRDALISLKINVLRDCKLADVLFLEKEKLMPEAYFENETSQPISLIFSEKKEAAPAQNLTAWPNPFSEKTTLAWSQTESGEATIEVFDATGRAVFSTKILGEKGANRFGLSGISEGLFFVKIQSGGALFTASILAN